MARLLHELSVRPAVSVHSEHQGNVPNMIACLTGVEEATALGKSTNKLVQFLSLFCFTLSLLHLILYCKYIQLVIIKPHELFDQNLKFSVKNV